MTLPVPIDGALPIQGASDVLALWPETIRRSEAAPVRDAMAEAMAAETMGAVRESVLGRKKESNPYNPSARMCVPSFLEAA